MRILLILFIFVFALSISAQTNFSDAYPELSEAEKKILNDVTKARASIAFCGYVGENEDCKKNDYEKAYRDALAQVANYPKVVNILVSAATKQYDQHGLQKKSAPQVSQLADDQNAVLMRIIVMQNQKIIELLELLAKKK